MSIYVKDYSFPTSLIDGAIIVFTLNTGERYTYKVAISYDDSELCFIDNLNGLNYEIFKVLGIKHKYDFIKNIVGYSPKEGDFPYVKKQDLRKVLLALAGYNHPKSISDEDAVRIIDKLKDKKEEKFTLSVKKHKQTKLNFTL